MKAILINDDRSLRWDDVPDPVTGPEDCLVKIEAAALNRADLMQREGDYPPPPGCPEWMGLEIAGTIVEVGPEAQKKSAWKVGDKVCALLGGGGYAQFANVKYDMLMPVPKNCSMVEAAAIPEAFATAYLNLFMEGGLKAGDTLLMNAGASGLASVVIPMAKAFGARVITTVLTEKIARSIEHLHADVVVHTEIDLKNIYVRNVRIIGSTLRSRTPETKARILANLVRDVWPKVEAGLVKPTIYKTLPIQEAEAAHEILYRGENVGKVVLTVE